MFQVCAGAEHVGEPGGVAVIMEGLLTVQQEPIGLAESAEPDEWAVVAETVTSDFVVGGTAAPRAGDDFGVRASACARWPNSVAKVRPTSKAVSRIFQGWTVLLLSLGGRRAGYAQATTHDGPKVPAVQEFRQIGRACKAFDLRSGHDQYFDASRYS
jgi:hypothetical protein